jgi:hypothetical protein
MRRDIGRRLARQWQFGLLIEKGLAMEEQAAKLLQIMAELTDVERTLLTSDQAKKQVVAVMFALERIGQAKMLLGRAQANLLGEIAKERGDDLGAFMLAPGVMNCHHALVHNPFDEGDSAI